MPLPCVIYCHGNSGCRADANEAAVILLLSNITIFTLDFSGLGLSDGDYVSLGWHEKDDLKVVVSYLRSNKQISRIGLWGRSMGAVTWYFISSLVNLFLLHQEFAMCWKNFVQTSFMELVGVYKIRLLQSQCETCGCIQNPASPITVISLMAPVKSVAHKIVRIESWGRCSSFGGSDEESSADCTAADRSHQTNLDTLVTPVRSIQKKSSDLPKEEKKKRKRKATAAEKKPKREKFEKLDALSKRLRLCIMRRVKHQRHLSS